MNKKQNKKLEIYKLMKRSQLMCLQTCMFLFIIQFLHDRKEKSTTQIEYYGYRILDFGLN